VAARESRFRAGGGTEVAGLLLRPAGAAHLLVLGHGAGAGMRHGGMEATARALAEAGVATFRYQFPYMERGGGPPDPRPILIATVRAAVAAAREAAPGLPLLAGGRSMGGRMTSHAAAEGGLPEVRGLVFFGFPLHPAGRPGSERAAHLPAVPQPLLFLQGTRDTLCDLDLLRAVLAGLPRATLHVAEGADHSFHVLKRTGRTGPEVMAELARVTRAWADTL